MNGLDDLDAEVAKKKRATNRRSEITPSPRHPKPQPEPTTEQADTPADGDVGVPASPDTGSPAHQETGTPVNQPAGVPVRPGASTPGGRPTGSPARQEAVVERTRPPSVEAYLTEDLADWLWQVRAAGMARREGNVASAVVRLALEELRERYTPEQIIATVQTRPQVPAEGRRGRRR